MNKLTYEVEVEHVPDSIMPNLEEIRLALNHRFVHMNILSIRYGTQKETDRRSQYMKNMDQAFFDSVFLTQGSFECGELSFWKRLRWACSREKNR